MALKRIAMAVAAAIKPKPVLSGCRTVGDFVDYITENYDLSGELPDEVIRHFPQIEGKLKRKG